MGRVEASAASPFYPVGESRDCSDSLYTGSSASRSLSQNDSGSDDSGSQFPKPPTDIYYRQQNAQRPPRKQPERSLGSPLSNPTGWASPRSHCATPAYSEEWRTLAIQSKKEILNKQQDRRYDEQVREDLDKLVSALAKAVEVRDSELAVVNQQYEEEHKWRLELEEQLETSRNEAAKIKERFNNYKVNERLQRDQSKSEDDERHQNEVELWEKSMEEIARMRVTMALKDDKIAEFEARCSHLQTKLDNQQARHQRELAQAQQKIKELSSFLHASPQKSSSAGKQQQKKQQEQQQQQKEKKPNQASSQTVKPIDLTRFGFDPASFPGVSAEVGSSRSNEENVRSDNKGYIGKPRSHDEDSGGAGKPTNPFGSADKSSFPHIIQDATLETEVVLKYNSNEAASKSPASGGAKGGKMQELQIEDALFYFESIKLEYSHYPNVYKSFLRIIKDYKNQSLSTPDVKERVCQLFSGKAKLILGFNQFLPLGYKISMEDVLRHQIASMTAEDDKDGATSTSGDASATYDGDDEADVRLAKSCSTLVSYLAAIDPGKIADAIKNEHRGHGAEMAYSKKAREAVDSHVDEVSSAGTPRSAMTPPRVPLFQGYHEAGTEMITVRNNTSNRNMNKNMPSRLPAGASAKNYNDNYTTKIEAGAPNATDGMETLVTIHTALSSMGEDVEVEIDEEAGDEDAGVDKDDSQDLSDKYDVLEADTRPASQGDSDDESSSLEQDLGYYRNDRYDLQKMGTRRRKMIIKELLEEAGM